MKVDHIIQDELIRFTEWSYEDEAFYLYLGANSIATLIIPNRVEVRVEGAPLPTSPKIKIRPVVRGPIDKFQLGTFATEITYHADGMGAHILDVRPSPRSVTSPTEISIYADADPALKMHEGTEFFLRIMRNKGF